MSIQEVAIANNQKKRLLSVVKDEAVLFQDENGELVVNVAHYKAFKKELVVLKTMKKGVDITPIETIVGAGVLNFDAEYFVFS
ncbi:MAG: hypothetical protein RPR40_11290 [Bermanella sp.]